ncbi:MAG TPA: 2-phosphosulfolactate phosphatase [Salinivirgaceae bacterium]|nr:2-phosphosulfolactate phosphatase [Salinivirgaceae bacterium]
METKPHLDICFSPLQYNVYHRPGNIVVLVDVIRATTVFATALFHGATKIVALQEIEETMEYGKIGYLTAGERNSYKLDGFDFGNSPLEYCNSKIKGKSIAITTTNGTQALSVVPESTKVVTGAWVNETVLLDYLRSCNKNILLLCAGWKYADSVEDTLFAGQLASKLLNDSHHTTSDSVKIAISLADLAKNSEIEFILSHSPRIKSKYNMLKDDIAYSLKRDIAPVIPKLVNEAFVCQ